MVLKFRSVLIVALSAFALPASAQTDSSKYEVGINLGTFIYQGDLTPTKAGSFKTAKFGINFSGSRILSNSLAVRVNLNFGKVAGNDAKYSEPAYRQNRNFTFSTSITEFSASLVYDILKHNHKVTKGTWSPYAFGGIGASFIHVKRNWTNAKLALLDSKVATGITSDAAKSLPKSLLVFPVGLGVRTVVSSHFSLSLESSYRLMSTDYLDGFSNSANSGKKDHYHFTSFGVIYKL